MTIINQTYKFIFIHIPKNAGTTVTNLLSAHTYWQDIELGGTVYGETLAPAYVKRFGIGKHTRAETVRNVVGDRVWSKYFKFAFVRNPYMRTLSTYHFLLKWRNWPNSQVMDQFDDFEAFVTSRFFQDSPGPDGMFLPQHSWICDVNGSSLLDYVCKVEDIDNDLFYIASKIPLTWSDAAIPKMNQSGNIEDRQMFHSEKTIKVIQSKYQYDFQKYNYGVSVEL